ncbi:MAG: hypothetical protein ABIS86_22815 [Streptosporangiaceae bacterium]
MRATPLLIGAAVAAAGLGAYGRRFRSWQLQWGSDEAEPKDDLPGDDLIRSTGLTATRSITIGAPPERVWPWIAQLGQGRGGFYSYDLLENLIGCDIHNAARVVARWQDTTVGDEVMLAPEIALRVALVEPERTLVLNGVVPVSVGAPPCDFTWAFVLREQQDGTTRLIVRERYAYLRWWAPLIIEPVELLSFLMTRKMLTGIKRRAEETAMPLH